MGQMTVPAMKGDACCDQQSGICHWSSQSISALQSFSASFSSLACSFNVLVQLQCFHQAQSSLQQAAAFNK